MNIFILRTDKNLDALFLEHDLANIALSPSWGKKREVPCTYEKQTDELLVEDRIFRAATGRLKLLENST